MIRRGLLAFGLVCGSLAWGPPARPGTADEPRLEAFRGLGTWVDIFERAYRHPERAVRRMDALGVRTLYLETSNYTQDRSIADPAITGRFVEAAHDRGMDVVAWYLPGFKRLRRDLARSMAAIRFRSASGQRFDAFGLDIEASIVDPPARRTRRLLSLSRRLRARAGGGYPLAAVVPSPRGIELAEGYWPGFPYVALSGIYDLFVPMGYFTYHGNGVQKTYVETVANVEILRAEVGDPTVPIHLIGGIADEASGPEVLAFVHAVREHGLLGASLYNYSLSRAHDWEHLGTIPANPSQSPALPLSLPFVGPVGNVPGEERTHPKEVVFRTGPLVGSRALSFEAFDAQAGEVQVLANWTEVGTAAPGTMPGSWAGPQQVTIPDEVLRDAGDNVISFVASGDHPHWSEWGIRSVSLA